MDRIAQAYSRAQNGLAAPLVTVQAHLSGGLPRFSIVGLAEKAVNESRDRVRCALINSRFKFPKGRITVNLAPADLPKEGGRFDLPIAIGILAASAQLPRTRLESCELIGELSLTGDLLPVRGALPVALRARDCGRALILPAPNADEAALVERLDVYPAQHLLEVCAHLRTTQDIEKYRAAPGSPAPAAAPDLAEVRGQQQAKRALEIAAAGGHSLLMIGPPGTGKSMLAARLNGILPPLTDDEALETAAVYSIAGRAIDVARWRTRPFRCPHHTASGVALVGGGSVPRPGEISLAHNGVLFLDELPEFSRHVLEVLREPIESGRIMISRAARQAEFPARFQLVAAMNPCPCGYLGDPGGRCACTADQVLRYRARISGPLLDRVDLHVEVPRLPAGALRRRGTAAESSVEVAARICAARERQLARGAINARLEAGAVAEVCRLDEASSMLLDEAVDKLGLSARACHRIVKVARSIADLAGREGIALGDVAEAVALRRLDRQVGV
ncbi:MAG TPA: YifB family Mg chelatase-like AAA ATPase [Gammaproteobacteria bacterium]|nr:YifB family Mg chelatase-like AAA ATPase [Gammaproteobacteria bacterium]